MVTNGLSVYIKCEVVKTAIEGCGGYRATHFCGCRRGISLRSFFNGSLNRSVGKIGFVQDNETHVISTEEIDARLAFPAVRRYDTE